MDQPLDLSITLTSPPQDSSPETIASMTVQCEALELIHTGNLLINPLTVKEREDLRWYLEEYWKWPYEGFALRGKQVEDLLVEVGKRLYEAAFGNSSTKGIAQAWQQQPDGQGQISITSDIPGVLSLPWELLHDADGFLALREPRPVSVVRRLPKREAEAETAIFELPLRILLVTARPKEAGFADPRSIARELLDELQEPIVTGTIELEFLRPPTLAALSTRLKDSRRPIHVLHFDGHGTFDERHKTGKLAFEDEEGKLHSVWAENLALVLRDSGVRLVVLNACHSATSATDDILSSVAIQLIQGGINAVIAMSASVLEVSAVRYVEAFYRTLTYSTHVLSAQEQARRVLYADPRRHLLRRRRGEEGNPIELCDWWIPHYYQQYPVVLQTRQIVIPKSEDKYLPSYTPVPRLNEEMPAEPRYGFIGRARELLRLERHLLRGEPVVVHGFGGVGKTALVHESADWLTRTGMYTSACFVSFDHGMDAQILLSTLGNFLGVYDAHYNSNDTKAALAQLEPVLKKRHTLIIADGVDSILSGGEAPLKSEALAHLWDVLLDLAEKGAGIVLTSRTTAFVKQLASRRRVAHLLLSGLHPEDAYTLASHLLDSLGIDRAKVAYSELRDLLVQLDYHPLAIHLVLPALRRHPIEKVRSDFAMLLAEFVDEGAIATERNKSLMASLNYSLQQLSEEQRTWLTQLAPFEGGAYEDLLLQITQIPQNEWVELRNSLERTALLTIEQIHKALPVPYLHFHPVLIPYLRIQPNTTSAELRERYIHQYYLATVSLYDEDNRHPQPIRALVLRELPNLRRALNLLLEEKDSKAANALSILIAHFLMIFGWDREREELQRQVREKLIVTDAQVEGRLTWGDFIREDSLGEEELDRGNLDATFTRYTALLARIVMQPEDAPAEVRQGSLAHCMTLRNLTHCLQLKGQLNEAEEQIRTALSMIEILLSHQPDDRVINYERGAALTQLGDVLNDQGKYLQAKAIYLEGLNVARQLDEPRPQAVSLAQLGSLAFHQHNYAEARSRYIEALGFFRRVSEPVREAVCWHQLGLIAMQEKNWVEAESCFRKSLMISEQLGDLVHATGTCDRLAHVAKESGHTAEAIAWSKRAMELAEHGHLDSASYAIYLNNLAYLILEEVQSGRLPFEHLAEASNYAERVLTILETQDTSSGRGSWAPLSILAKIADLEGRTEIAQSYLRRSREAYAAFAGNRYPIYHRLGLFIANCVAAARGNTLTRADAEENLLQLESDGWHIAAAIHRIWMGQRDWHTLAEDLEGESALVVLRVLEILAQLINTPPPSVDGRTTKEVLNSLPIDIRNAVEQGDREAFRNAFEVFSPEDQQEIAAALCYLRTSTEHENIEEKLDTPELTALVKQLELVLQGIAAVSRGDIARRGEIELLLLFLKMNVGSQLNEVVPRIWRGERDWEALSAGLGIQDKALVRRILEILSE